MRCRQNIHASEKAGVIWKQSANQEHTFLLGTEVVVVAATHLLYEKRGKE